jgi:hypothetical protein
MTEYITINIKFFADLDQETNLLEYDYAKGLTLDIKKVTRLRTVLKSVDFIKKRQHIFFLGSKRISVLKKLKEGDRISCLLPSGGG